MDYYYIAADDFTALTARDLEAGPKPGSSFVSAEAKDVMARPHLEQLVAAATGIVGPSLIPELKTLWPRARDAGFPIEEIRQVLELWRDRERSSADVKALALSRAAQLRRKARELEAMRRSLEHLAERCHGDDRPDCPILIDLEGKD